MRAVIIAALFALGFCGPAAASPPSGPGGYYQDWVTRSDRSADPDPAEFKLINYFFTRATVSNQIADPSGLRGVSLGPIGIGEGAGSATAVGDDIAWYVEQRWIPVLSYSPLFGDGLATFRAQFEVDFTWGQAANQIQNNQGGGLNADQVNLQTKNLNVGLYPTRKPGQLSILLGTQPVYDSIYDPTITSLFKITDTGYKLAYMGTDGTMASAYGHFGDHYFKASFLPIGATQPDKAEEGDPRLSYVYMLTADYAHELSPGTTLGASLWHLRDDSKGKAFAYEGLVPSGPSSSGLYPYTGVADLDIEAPTGSVTWVGTHFHHNIDFATGDFGFSGFFMANFGEFTSHKDDTTLNETLSVLGWAANLELLYNYGQTAGDLITLEGMFSNGDEDLKDGDYEGAFTLNHYGLPGGVWFDHKTLILFPFTSTVSNYTGAVTDISNRGYGLQAGIASGAMDLVPNKLNLKVGAAYAQAAVTPPKSDFEFERGRTIGAEFNVELKYHLRYLMTVGLHGGWMKTGAFFNATDTVDGNPWAAFSTFTWYGF